MYVCMYVCIGMYVKYVYAKGCINPSALCHDQWRITRYINYRPELLRDPWQVKLVTNFVTVLLHASVHD